MDGWMVSLLVVNAVSQSVFIYGALYPSKSGLVHKHIVKTCRALYGTRLSPG